MEPTNKFPVVRLLLACIAGWLILGDDIGGGCTLPIVNDPPPFVTTTPVSVLIVEENRERGNYTPGQQAVIKSTLGAKAYVEGKGGSFIVLDKDTPTDKAAPWVQEAMKAVQPNLLPWMVAANPKTGKSMQLPKEEPETIAILKQLGGD